MHAFEIRDVQQSITHFWPTATHLFRPVLSHVVVFTAVTTASCATASHRLDLLWHGVLFCQYDHLAPCVCRATRVCQPLHLCIHTHSVLETLWWCDSSLRPQSTINTFFLLISLPIISHLASLTNSPTPPADIHIHIHTHTPHSTLRTHTHTPRSLTHPSVRACSLHPLTGPWG